MDLRVVTFNIRNTNDRYDERKPVLARAFGELAPDICGLQEVMFGGDEAQDDLLAKAVVPPRAYLSFGVESERYPRFGNAILCDIGQVQAHETLRMSKGRMVQRVLVLLPGNLTLWFANTHLHHRPGEPEVRLEQVQTMLAWLEEAPGADAMIVCGDFNASPREPAYAAMQGAGFRSACFEANGREPEVTWPSGIQAPTMDTDGDPNCLDYIWLRGRASAITARVAANGHAPGDPTLYPSDHFALLAALRVG